MSKIKGGKPAARQNFSMHPDLLETLVAVSYALNAVGDPSNRKARVSFSTVAAALVWKMKETLLTPDGKITPELQALIADFQASFYEDTGIPVASENK